MSHDPLPDDLWRRIGCKLDSLDDRIRFRAVSKSWNSLLPFRQPPWLMLSEEEEFFPPPWLMLEEEDEAAEKEEEAAPRRGFVSIGQQLIHKIDFPEAHQSRVVGSAGNWLITLDLNKTLRILNPFSRREFYLLPPIRVMEHSEYLDPESSGDYVNKIILSSSPDRHDCFAILIHHEWLGLAIARPGDESWTTLHSPPSSAHQIPDVQFYDVIFYKQHFYAVEEQGRLIIFDIGDSLRAPKHWYLNDGIEVIYSNSSIYLVEWAGELLLVVKSGKFDLYKLDSKSKEWSELKSLGEYSLFLGLNTSISLLASDYFGVMRRNCIYFTNNFKVPREDSTGGPDIGVFDLEDDSITPHFKGMSTSSYSPPIWIIPS